MATAARGPDVTPPPLGRGRRPAGRSTEPLPSPQVLVVDDVQEVRELFAQFLRRAGMCVTQADGGRAALATVRDAKPDLIVSDLSMPDMDGLELCRRIRADPSLSDVPILIVSGNAPTGDAAVWAAGCNAVLEKPCSRELLVAAAHTLLGNGAPRKRDRVTASALRAGL